MNVKIFACYDHETLAVDPALRRELDRLSRDADLDSQRALDAFLQRHGRVVRRRRVRNLVPDAAKTWIGQTLFGSTGYTAAFYVGIKGTGAVAAADVMNSHAAWTELTAYSQTTRPTMQLGTWATGAASNSSNPALFTATAALTIAGAFVTTNSTKGGATGTLISATNFTAGNRALASGETERVTVGFTIS